MIFQILAPHFCAGGVVDKDNIVSSAAPILKYMRGWKLDKVIQYCTGKGWTFRSTKV